MTSSEILTDEQLLNEVKVRLLERQRTNHSNENSLLEEELRTLSLRLRESERGKSDFLSNVRNEINNPLTSILGLSLSIMKMTPDEKVRKLSDLIHQQAFELDFQMRNIIAAAEIESGVINPVSAHIDIESLLQAQVDYLNLKVHSSGVKVDIKVEPPRASFSTDPNLLQAIVSNLLANAIEFSNPESEVLLVAHVFEDSLRLLVKDFGIGIKSEKQAIIFDRFRQLDSGTTKVHHGQGLGLAIVREFVSMLNGEIQLTSEEHKGTSVILQIPQLALELTSQDRTKFGNEILFASPEEF